MNPPRTVWRVGRYGNNGNGIMPRGIPDFQDDEDFEAQVQRHLNWDRQFASPFLSTFSREAHAIWWGNRVYNDGVLYEIDTTNLEMHRRGQPDEFLIVGGIPQRNIRRTSTVEDEVNRLNAQAMEIDRTPRRYWSIEFQRYFIDEDEELEEIDENHFIEYMMNH